MSMISGVSRSGNHFLTRSPYRLVT